jgi:hypothetical protein
MFRRDTPARKPPAAAAARNTGVWQTALLVGSPLSVSVPAPLRRSVKIVHVSRSSKVILDMNKFLSEKTMMRLILFLSVVDKL